MHSLRVIARTEEQARSAAREAEQGRRVGRITVRLARLDGDDLDEVERLLEQLEG